MFRMCVLCGVVLVFLGPERSLCAADGGPIDAAIQKGRGYLAQQVKGAFGGAKSLAAYALLKTGTQPDDPVIQEALAAAVNAVEFYGPGKPRTSNAAAGHRHAEFAYTIPCHIFLLEAANAALYLPQIESLTAFLIEHQQENGSWFYVVVPFPDAGDTSQTQFALLGLWAAARAGAEIPTSTWEKAARWLLQTQLEDGSFAYQPYAHAEDQKFRLTRYSTTVGGLSSLLLIRHLFYRDAEFLDEQAAMNKPKKRRSFLERLEDVKERPRRGGGEFHLSASALDKGISRCMKYLEQRFDVRPIPDYNPHMYTLYSLERSAALLDTDTLVNHDWYAEASAEIVRLQTAEGAWSDATGHVPATSFAILCLSRTTAGILNKPPGKKVGGGLLAGARGLPGDLSKLQLKAGQAVERKSKGNVDDLLAELEKTQNVAVADLEKAIVESVNLDDRDQLIGQIDRLRRLAVDPRPEVRRIALWAIGRSGEIRLAPVLIGGLQDVDVDVIREASYGLTVLSRKPTGLLDDKGKPIPVEPLDGLDEDAADGAREKHLEQWIARATAAWRKWYLSVRPYDERDDRQQLQKKR
jgi:hypothetical protein